MDYKKYPWKAVADELLSIAKAGLHFSENPYDLDRFERLKVLGNKILQDFTDASMPTLNGLFDQEVGYPTPKVDVRGVVMREGKVLLVKEKDNGLWSLPGGWADIGLTPAENVVKEIMEEASLEVEAERLLAVWDKKCHPHPPEPHYAYKIFILCRIISGVPKPGEETEGADFFSLDELPPISENRNTTSQIHLLHNLIINNKSRPMFD